ncbi:septal ring lytic transglycosylase RlpA family protein [Myroides pelagicus]
MEMRNVVLLIVFFSFYSFVGKPQLMNNESKSYDEVQSVLTDTVVMSIDSVATESKVELEEEEIQYELIDEETKASYYHDKFTGRKTASGAVFNNAEYTAAHKTLPFGTKVKVTNITNQRSVILTITDRGPFIKGRSIDLSKRAFFDLTDNKKSGVLNVKIERILEE